MTPRRGTFKHILVRYRSLKIDTPPCHNSQCPQWLCCQEHNKSTYALSALISQLVVVTQCHQQPLQHSVLLLHHLQCHLRQVMLWHDFRIFRNFTIVRWTYRDIAIAVGFVNGLATKIKLPPVIRVYSI